MVTDPFAAENLLPPWHPAGKHAQALEKELRKEIGPGHLLHGRRIMALAFRNDPDDVLVAVNDPTYPLAAVRLRWGVSGDTPDMRRFSSIEEWRVYMRKGSDLSGS